MWKPVPQRDDTWGWELAPLQKRLQGDRPVLGPREDTASGRPAANREAGQVCRHPDPSQLLAPKENSAVDSYLTPNVVPLMSSKC